VNGQTVATADLPPPPSLEAFADRARACFERQAGASTTLAAAIFAITLCGGGDTPVDNR